MKSMYISVISLIVTLITLFYIVCIGVESDHAAMLISILGTLVTALMGWNIVQYLYAKDEVHRIAKEESDKAAGEAAKRVQSDLKLIADALSPLINARIDTVFSDSTRAIGFYLTSLDKYNHIQDSNLRQEYISSLLEELSHRVQTWKKENILYYQKCHIEDAVSLLDTFDSPLSEEIKEALLDAPEWNPNEKRQIGSIKTL